MTRKLRGTIRQGKQIIASGVEIDFDATHITFSAGVNANAGNYEVDLANGTHMGIYLRSSAPLTGGVVVFDFSSDPGPSPSRKALESAVEEVARKGWPAVGPGDDANTIDIFYCAKSVEAGLNLRLPALGIVPPPSEKSVALVDLVGRYLVTDKCDLIRALPATVLSRRALDLVDAIEREHLLSFGDQSNFVIALYTYHGFFDMAKLVRPRYRAVGGDEPLYSLPMRNAGYSDLEKCWLHETARGNPWVEHGVSLARMEQTAKGRPIVDDWLQDRPDSPYWRK